MKIINYIPVLLFSCFLLFGSYKIYKKNVDLDLNKTTKIVGQITKAFTTTRRPGGKGKRVPIFAFNIDNTKQTLGVYRPSRDYTFLLENLKIGDIVTVYYKPVYANSINIDVYQVEKNGIIIVDYKDFNRNHAFLSVLLGIVGLLLLTFVIYKIRS